MRTWLPLARLRRLAGISRGAITDLVEAFLRRALLSLASAQERLGLAGVFRWSVAAPRPRAPRERGENEGARGTGRVHAESVGAWRTEEGAPAPERGGATPGIAAEATAQLQHVALVVPPEPSGSVARGEPVAARAAATDGEAADIPWSYGKDRVTAAAVDPNRLYVSWEVTDEAIDRARSALGAAGADAGLSLRVYDTTGILFDGTNARHQFDHEVGRSERQWFFDVRRPGSTAFVEVGLRAGDGGFARIARSGRVDYPPAQPAPWTDPEWMTVVASTGEARLVGRSTPSPGGEVDGPHPPERPDGGPPAAPQPFVPIPLWVIRDAAGHAAWVRELTPSGWERLEWREVEGEHGIELLRRLEWEGPRTLSTWEAGPFTYPVEVREPTREEWEGRSVVYRVGGMTRVVHGPWQVVIRNLGAHLSRTVLARWEIHRSWAAEGGRVVRPGAAAALAPPGASEALAGASERAWASGSELRLGGASEVWRLGGSELRFRGASELLFAGASQWLVRGASEQILRGGSEWLARGASEQVRRGASEQLQQGASERLFRGASERALAGEPQGGSEGRLAPPAAPAAGYPKAE